MRLDCPECDNPTLVINEESPSGYRCTFCENEKSDELPAIRDVCGAQMTRGELDYWQIGPNEEEARCYYCSGRYQVEKDD